MPQDNIHNEFFLYFNIFSLKQSEQIIRADVTKDKLITQSANSLNIYELVVSQTIHDTSFNHVYGSIYIVLN